MTGKQLRQLFVVCHGDGHCRKIFIEPSESKHRVGGQTYHPSCCPREGCELEHPGPVDPDCHCGNIGLTRHGKVVVCARCGRSYSTITGDMLHVPETTRMREIDPQLYAECVRAFNAPEGTED